MMRSVRASLAMAGALSVFLSSHAWAQLEPAAPADPSAAAAAGAPAAVHKPRKHRVAVAAMPAEDIPPMSWDGLPVLDAGTLDRLTQLQQYYSAVEQAGGFGPTPPAGLGQSSSGDGVIALRRRLIMEGDLQPGSESNPAWDGDVTVAVERFQSRYDLAVTGTVTAGMRSAMAVPAGVRLAQIAKNVERLSAHPVADFGSRYIEVNLPSTQVEAVEGDHIARQYKAIVGRTGNQSPLVDAQVSAININPYWTLPWSIIKKEIAPHVAANPGYLASQRMKVMDFHGHDLDPSKVDWSIDRPLFTVRQDNGVGNALGQLRIQMPNSEAVYMHDTPSKGLFGANDRFFSHGCVRVQGVNDLAAWVLGGDWTSDKIVGQINTGKREDLPVADQVPVHWVYMTVYVTADGSAHFRDDIYGLDSGKSEAVYATATPLATAAATGQVVQAATAQAAAVTQ